MVEHKVNYWIFPINPVPKPRQTQSDRWKKRPAVLRYRAFADEVRLRMGDTKLEGSCVVFFIPMPRSWSQAKRAKMLGQPHRSRPDLSNLLKALEDALYGEDAHIAHYGKLAKVWGERGEIMVKEGCRDADVLS